MVDQAFVNKIVEDKLAELGLFLVDLKIDMANKIDIAIDGDNGVGIDQCIAVSRAVEGSLDREKEDFELMVASPGVGQPLKVHRQYAKAIGRPVEVQLLDGSKVAGTLSEVTEADFEVTFSRKELVEGTKKKQTVEVKQRIAFADAKSTKETISFK
jgi:ribosome maturation factor RimP